MSGNKYLAEKFDVGNSEITVGKCKFFCIMMTNSSSICTEPAEQWH